MFESKLVLVLNPQLLDRFEEDKTTEEMVNKAVQKGYKLSAKTPAFLFKYPAIIDLVFATNNTDFITEFYVDIMMQCESKRTALFEYISSHIENVSYKYLEKYFQYIEPSDKLVPLLQRGLRYEYISYNPEYAYDENFDLDNYPEPERLIEIFKEKNVDITKIKNVTKDYFEIMVLHFPNVFHCNLEKSIYISKTLIDNVIVALSNDVFDFEDVPKVFLEDDDFVKKLIVKFPNMIDVLGLENDSIPYTEIFNCFIDDLPESLNRMEYISSKKPDWTPEEKTIRKIIDSITNSDFLITDCYWSFIYDNKDLMLEQLRKNPNFINTSYNLFKYVYLNQDELNEIYEILKNSDIDIYTFHKFFIDSDLLLHYVLSKNPNLMNVVDFDFANHIRYYTSKFDDIVLPVVPGGMLLGSGIKNKVVEAVRRNPENIYSFAKMPLEDEVFDEAFLAAIESMDDPESAFFNTSLPTTDLKMIYSLKKGRSKLSEISFPLCDRNDYMRPLYWIANHSDYVKDDSTFSYFLFGRKEEVQERKSDLEFDLTNIDIYLAINDETKLKELCVKYYQLPNRDIVNYVDAIKNPYVFIHELLEKDCYPNNNLIELNDVQLEYFDELFKKLNKEVNQYNFYYIRDNDLILEAVKKGEIDVHYMKYEYLSDEYRELVNEIFIKRVENGDTRKLPNQFFIDNYEYCKDKIESLKLLSVIEVSDLSFEEKKVLISDLYRSKKCLIPRYLIGYLDVESALEIIKTDFYNFSDINLNSPYEGMTSELIEGFKKIKEEYIDFDDSRKYSLEEVEKLYNQNRTNTMILYFLFKNGSIDLETYKKYYLLCLDNVKKGYGYNSFNFNFNKEFNENFDYELVDFLLKSNVDFCSKYLLSCIDKHYDIVIKYLFENANVFEYNIRHDFLRYLNVEDIKEYFSNNPSVFYERTFSDVYGILVDKKVEEQAIYDYWVLAGKPVDTSEIISNRLILQDLLNGDISIFDKFKHLKYYDSSTKKIIYDYYKEKGYNDFSVSPLFYRNDLILMDALGMSFDGYIDRLESDKIIEIYLRKLKDNPEFVYKIDLFLEIDLSFKKLLNSDPVSLIPYFTVRSKITNLIINKLKTIDFVPDKNISSIYLEDDYLLMLFINNHQDMVVDIIDFIKHKRENKNISSNVRNAISNVLVSNNVYGYFDYVDIKNNVYYYLDSLRSDFRNIERIQNTSLNCSVLKSIYQIAKEAILSGAYEVNENTPDFLFYNNEIRNIIRKTNPDLLDGFMLERLDKVFDCSLIDKALNDLDNIDQMFVGVERNYPESVVNPLVEKLIERNYIYNQNTPKFLLCNSKFMYYLLKNNMSVPSKYIDNFVTFENYYKTKDKDLFTKLINSGYGVQFRNFIKKFGLDETLELASELGYMLNLIDFNLIKDRADIIANLVKNGIVDVFDRVDIKELYKECINKNVYIRNYFEYIMSDYLLDYKKYENEIIFLIDKGYDLCSQNNNSQIFLNNDYLLGLFIENVKLLNQNDMRLLDYAINKASNEALTKKNILMALKRGYLISKDTPQVIFENSEYVLTSFRLCNDCKKITQSVNECKGIILNDLIVNELLNVGYSISYSSPKALLSNISFLSKYFMKLTSAPDFVEDIRILDVSVVDILLGCIDFNKFVLYFKGSFESDDKFNEFASKFFKYGSSKKDVVLKMLRDGKKLSGNIRMNYEKYIAENIDTIQLEDMDKVINCLYRIQNSNSGEIRQFANTLIAEVLKLPDYEKAFDNVEQIFLQQSLPMVMKLFLVFKVLHKDYSSFVDKYQNLSVVLKNCKDDKERDEIIYRDLVEAAFASNNRSLRDYLNTLSNMCVILERYEKNNSSVDEVDVVNALNFILMLANFEHLKEHIDKEEKVSGDFVDEIEFIRNKFGSFSNLKDSIVQNLFGFATFSEAVSYLSTKANEVDVRNQARAFEEFKLEDGDFIKGLGEIKYISNILQNGSVSREFLGEAAGSDLTPLDTDLSLIIGDTDSIADGLTKVDANGYGPIWIILKNNGSFYISRSHQEDSIEKAEYVPLVNEAFFTGALSKKTHYGIRTGFPSSDIDCFVIEKYDQRLGLEIALNGFYIPVISKIGELLFSPDDYKNIREKMSGLEYYDAGLYKLASKEELLVAGISDLSSGIDENRRIVSMKHNAIKEAVRKGMAEAGIIMKDKLDGNLVPGYADLIDTGSTARGTDVPGKADFDYICRVDRNLYLDPEKFEIFKKAIKSQFVSIGKEEYADGGHFRFKDVKIEGLDDLVDLDLSFVVRTTKLSLSSDESLLKRLDAIENGQFVSDDSVVPSAAEARNLVTANILLAKKLFKAYKAYKNRRNPDTPQGGLGGIGIENWILQYGGSLKRAAEDFLHVASQSKDFEDFKTKYNVWDFGENHYSFEKGTYSHDDFVYNNMNSVGYERMKIALENYLKMGEKAFDEDVIANMEDIIANMNFQKQNGYSM